MELTTRFGESEACWSSNFGRENSLMVVKEHDAIGVVIEVCVVDDMIKNCLFGFKGAKVVDVREVCLKDCKRLLHMGGEHTCISRIDVECGRRAGGVVRSRGAHGGGGAIVGHFVDL